MDNKRPVGREKNVIGSGNVYKKGNGQGTGPVGSTGGSHGNSSGGSNGKRAAGGGGIIAIILALILGGGGALFGLGGGSGSGGDQVITGGEDTNDTKVDTSVATGARNKYTTIKGNGNDIITMMVYMCGTDLESKSGMATADLQEMMNATVGKNINLIVYTGGCKAWKNSAISSDKNQIYQIKDGKLYCLEKDMGSPAMTKPETLTSFIQYCTKNFPANRNQLIFWDHGGGSLSGYGYDEKNSSSGSMTLAGINTALKNANTKFDFIGFDACLMATMENALMLTSYADYMIASEETEPGVGWYYTNWLSALSKDTSMSTVQIGKNIIDDFVDVCAQKCRGQQTTLSIVDLAELQETAPEKLTAFAKATNDMIKDKEYQKVSDARNNAREFARSSKIDQVDLINLAKNLDNKACSDLIDVIKSAVKYNRTSSNMTNAYGLSIYFPYKKANKVSQAVNTYNQIGMDAEYARCIQEFASLEVGGQISTGGNNSSPFSSLSGAQTGGNAGATGGNGDLISNLLSGLLSGNSGGLSGFDSSALSIFTGRNLSTEEQTDYISNHYFDAEQIVWVKDGDNYKVKLPESQWDLVEKLDLNVFVDDGEGYIDLGLDNVYTFDDDGNLVADYDNTWLSIDGQIVAYYHTDTVEEDGKYSITGYVPAKLNGERVEVILTFDSDNPKGYIAGARYVYVDGETETVAKSMEEIVKGDKLEFLCDYYSYDGKYLDSYQLGEVITIGDTVTIGDLAIENSDIQVTYMFTDIYQQTYWTPVVPQK